MGNPTASLSVLALISTRSVVLAYFALCASFSPRRAFIYFSIVYFCYVSPDLIGVFVDGDIRTDHLEFDRHLVIASNGPRALFFL